MYGCKWIGVNGNLLALMESFLFASQQRVVLDKQESLWLLVHWVHWFMYIYIYIYIYVCVCVCVFVCVCVCACVSMGVWACVCVCVCMHVYVLLFIHYLQFLSFYLLFHCFYCCFLFSFGLFGLNTIRSEQCFIERCYGNIVLNLNG